MKFTPEVLLSAPQRSAGVPNPAGTLVLYTTSEYSFETHKKTTAFRVLDVRTGESKELAHDDNISDFSWLNDDELTCLQAEKDGTTSVFVGSVAKVIEKPEMGTSHYVAGKIAAPAGNLKIAPLGKNEYAVVLSAQASPDGTLYEPAKAKKTQSTGRLYKSLYVRHWDEYVTKEKNTLWYGTLKKDSSSGKYELSALTNALKDTGLECPAPHSGGTDSFDVSKYGIIFVAKAPDVDPALNTKCNVYLIHLDNFESASNTPKPQNIPMRGFDGAASSPVFSSDGKMAAWLSMRRAGCESDKNHMFVLPDVNAQESAERMFSDSGEDQWDRSPQVVSFSADSKTLYGTVEDLGYGRLFGVSVDSKGQQGPRLLTNHGYISDVRPMNDGRIFVSGSSLTDSSFYAIVDPSIEVSGEKTLEVWNHSLSELGDSPGLSRSQVSSIWTPASNPTINEEVHSWVFHPSKHSDDTKSSKKYPVAYLIHGGPTGCWADRWSTRWNLAVFAEQGYIVVAPNLTGSTGYGQAFTDSARCNFGNWPYKDLENVFDWVGKNIPEADNDRAVALGSSFGGYMMNWIQGHPLGRKLKALVCHDGLFSMAGLLSTDELYFSFYDLGGTPWKSADGEKQKHLKAVFGASEIEAWRKNDPSEFLANWATPQLVIHNSKDYRLCISEGLSTFNVLQSRGIESEFLTFPDENHFTLKPENSMVWHKTVLNWINKYAGLPPFAEEDADSEEYWGGVREDKDAEVVKVEGQGEPET